jgi:hypothetical protein
MKAVAAILFAVILGLSGCPWFDRPRPEPVLPEPTAEGAGTFGCRVNGRAWVPRRPFYPIPEALYFRFDSVEEYFYISADRLFIKDSVDQHIYFHIGSPLAGDTLWLGTEKDTIRRDIRYASFSDGHLNEYFQTWNEDSLFFSGYVHITSKHLQRDSLTRYIAGTFAFTARTKDSTQYVEITDGRFDVPVW